MPIVEFVGSSRADKDNQTANPSRLVNYYRENLGERVVLKSVPGMVQFADLQTVLGYAMKTVNGVLYVAAGGALYRADRDATVTNLGTLPTDAATIMDGYVDNVTIAAGGRYYVYDGDTITQYAAGALSNIGSVCFLSGYTILTEKGGSKFEWTDLQDPASRNALNVATAEGRDDHLLRGVSAGGNLYLFGTESIEIWTLTGAANADAFSRLGGGVIDRGLKAVNLLADVDGTLFFVGNDNVAYLMSGASLRPISAPSVETAIKSGEPTNCFYYEDEGHKFCVIRFADRPSWVFDIAMGEWHERATGNDLSAWKVPAAERAYGTWFGVDNLGIISSLDGPPQDLGETMVRVATSTTLDMGPKFRVPIMEVRAKSGYAENAADGAVMLRTSETRGATWGPDRTRYIGTAGQYRDRAVWRSLGQHRTFTAEISQSGPTDQPLFTDAWVETA